MTVFLFSLTGLPPTMGFIGKFFLFAAMLEGNVWWLALLAVVNSVISLYYYMRIVKAMYFTESEEQGSLRLSPSHLILVLFLAVPTVVFGLFWGGVKEMADASARWLFGG